MTNVDLAWVEFAFVAINHFCGAPARAGDDTPARRSLGRGAEPDYPIRGDADWARARCDGNDRSGGMTCPTKLTRW